MANVDLSADPNSASRAERPRLGNPSLEAAA